MKYIEEYLKNIIKVKPLGKLTTEEDELDGISGEMVYIDGKCSNIFISHIDYANWLEKQGNNLVKNGYTNNKDYIRYADKYSYEIWRKLMDNFKNIKDYHIGCNDVLEIVLNAIIDTFNWLEKGGDKNKVSQHVEAINEEKVDTANKVEPTDYSSIDPHFFKTTDKVEPKFHEGDWITNGNYTWKIVEVKPLDYILQSQDGNIVDDTISYVDEQFHFFTIEDAKDGDVLVTVYDKQPFIYKGCLDPNHPDSPVAYCGIDSEGYFICSCVDKFNHWWTDEKVQPATKEQRDLLFQKMKEDGYEWDEKKKESKKIKMLPTEWSEEDELSCFESALFTAFSDAWQSYLLGEEVNVKQWAKEQSKELLEAAKEELKGHNSAWSEEDKTYLDLINTAIKLYYTDDKGKENPWRNELLRWLKSLKERIGG